MPRKSVTRDKSLIDLNFLLPAEVEDFIIDEPENVFPEEEAVDELGVVIDESGGTVIPDEDENSLIPPDSITIVSQNIRRTQDGTVVIDVFIDVADNGASSYNIRYTPA